jgi:hypothetical protein
VSPAAQRLRPVTGHCRSRVTVLRVRSRYARGRRQRRRPRPAGQPASDSEALAATARLALASCCRRRGIIVSCSMSIVAWLNRNNLKPAASAGLRLAGGRRTVMPVIRVTVSVTDHHRIHDPMMIMTRIVTRTRMMLQCQSESDSDRHGSDSEPE